MKKLTVPLIFILCAALLTACGATAAPGNGEDEPAAPSYTAAPPVTAGPESTPAPEPENTATPEPPSTVPDPAPAPEKNGLYDLLADVFDNYHFGVAGSSLKGAYCAASIVEWGAENGADAVRAGASAWDRGLETEYGESFGDKLDSLYAAALAFYGAGTRVLEDCGWTGEWTYSGEQVRAVFREIYPALGLEVPDVITVYYPDADAESLRARGVLLTGGEGEDTAAALTAALAGSVLSEDAAALSAELTDGTLHLDMNAAFLTQLRSYGSSGETLTVAALANTAIDRTGADSVLLTVEGAVMETGHDVYDRPITFYEG